MLMILYKLEVRVEINESEVLVVERVVQYSKAAFKAV
jgi:hypothetical protein